MFVPGSNDSSGGLNPNRMIRQCPTKMKKFQALAAQIGTCRWSRVNGRPSAVPKTVTAGLRKGSGVLLITNAEAVRDC